MKILLTGKNGQVGWELQRTLCTLGDVVALGSAELDLSDPDAIVRIVRDIKPDLIVNPAAYTAVDKAESEPDLAMAVNGRAPGILAEEAKRLGAMFVHYSTDYVFDGSKTTPYVETDIPSPLSVYGRTKLEGERAIQAVGGRHLIFRTSWVYGARGKNFVLTMLRLMREREQVKVVDDQYGAPTWSRWLASATLQILASRPLQEFGTTDALYHLAAGGEVTWHELAGRIKHIKHCPAEVLPIPASEYPAPAARPYNSRLDGEKIKSGFGIHRADWDDLLDLCLAEIDA